MALDKDSLGREKPRLLVFVVAYYAESTLASVLERLPSTLLERYACEVLVVDDASEDRTYAIGREYQCAHPEVRMTVLRNEHNQGYGGNQKVGYSYAIRHGFDFVALLHGDGQYAPEEMENLTAPLAEGRADAVFGSRMLQPSSALRGGMPLYKFVGNKILSKAQNLLLRSNLSEFHSGYRVYAVPTLERIPFLLNSNDFHFDTEIIIQLLNARARILELHIPTRYGDEVCRVNGLKYAKDVMLATVRNVAHRWGLLYQRRYDPHWKEGAHYDVKLGYASSHSYALDAVASGSKVIDLGSGPGGVAQELLRKGCEVTAVDQHSSGWDGLPVRVVQQDLDTDFAFDVKGNDYILMLDVIEHLRDPENFLEQLRSQFDYVPQRLILTTPNVAFVVQRLMLLLGQFNYGKAGILDRTHARLFTFDSLKRLLNDAGFQLRTVKGIPAPFPKVVGDGPLGRALVRANLALISVSKTLFAYQIYVEVDTTPSVKFILDDATTRAEQPLNAAPPPKGSHHASANGSAG